MSMLFKKVAARMFAMGVHGVPAQLGQRKSLLKNWGQLVTNDPGKIDDLFNAAYDQWGEDDYNFIAVAREDGACLLDIDDYAAAVAMGMPPLPEDVYIVDTASGHLHGYFAQTDASRALGNQKICHDGHPIVELKVRNMTVAGIYSVRNDGVQGTYTPRIKGSYKLTDIPDNLVRWVAAHSGKMPERKSSVRRAEFHPSFDREDWLDWTTLPLTGREIEKGGVLYVELEICPFKGERHSGASKFVTCITFGERIGFSCMGCDTTGQHHNIGDLQTLLEDQYGVEPYAYMVYKHQDKKLMVDELLNNQKFSVEEV